MVVVFFFQAEDGIRYRTVTGVQTCALPISGRWRALRLLWFALVWLVLESAALFACLGLWITSGFGGRLHSEPYQERHYAIMRWFLDVMFQVATSVFQLRVEVEEPERTPRELAARLAG